MGEEVVRNARSIIQLVYNIDPDIPPPDISGLRGWIMFVWPGCVSFGVDSLPAKVVAVTIAHEGPPIEFGIATDAELRVLADHVVDGMHRKRHIWGAE